MEGKVSLYRYSVRMHMVLPYGYSVQSGNLPKSEVTVVRTNNRVVGFSCISDLHQGQFNIPAEYMYLYSTIQEILPVENGKKSDIKSLV